MNLEKIKQADTQWIGKHIEYQPQMDSTQEEAQKNRKTMGAGKHYHNR